jgi:predicted RNA polymerase sigma factor
VSGPYRLIVTDTSPLFTLVLADSLDVLRALLLFEDSDIERRRAVVDERVDLISTGDFLRELEAAHLIQSSDYILDQAAAQGRPIERQRQAVSDLDGRERLKEHLHRDRGLDR